MFIKAIPVFFRVCCFKNYFTPAVKNYKVIKADVFKWLKQIQTIKYDLIFADPPYDHIGMSQLPELIFSNNLLTPDGLLVIEHRTSLTFQNTHLKYHRDYGQSRFSFFSN